MTATEASRQFATLLDQVERGETVVLTRGGRRIASIGPVAAGNGAELLDLLRTAEVDAQFADDVRAARDIAALVGPASPDD